jgi:hypothetical protein
MPTMSFISDYYAVGEEFARRVRHLRPLGPSQVLREYLMTAHCGIAKQVSGNRHILRIIVENDGYCGTEGYLVGSENWL